MKIVDRKTFLSLPAGTVFSKYKPCVFGHLEIKVDDGSWGDDFVVQCISDAFEHDGWDDYEAKCRMMEKGEDVRMDFDCAGRDGLFDPYQLFAVWSKSDIQSLISKLNKCLE